MALVLSNNATLQVIAALVVFLFGYLAFFVFLIVCLLIATGLYEGAKAVRFYAVTSGSANRSRSSDVEMPAHREKSFVIPAW